MSANGIFFLLFGIFFGFGLFVFLILAVKERIDTKNGKVIVKTIILGDESQKSTSSSIGRGLVGSALFGGIGAIGGALSGKNKNYTTFLVFYKNGTRESKTVLNNSPVYRQYIQYLEV